MLNSVADLVHGKIEELALRETAHVVVNDVCKSDLLSGVSDSRKS